MGTILAQLRSGKILALLLLSNHTIKNIQSSICKFEVPLFHLHSKLSNPLFLSHPFGNRHDYMHGKTLLGKSNGFKSFSLQMFPPGEGEKKKKKVIIILSHCSFLVLPVISITLSFCSFFPSCFSKYTTMPFSLLFLALQGSLLLSPFHLLMMSLL